MSNFKVWIRQRVSKRLDHWKLILWRPLVIVAYAPYVILGLLVLWRDELVKHKPEEKIWHIADLLPDWSISTWIAGGLAILVVLALEYSYRLARAGKLSFESTLTDTTARHHSEIVAHQEKLTTERSAHAETSHQLRLERENLKDCPQIKLACSANFGFVVDYVNPEVAAFAVRLCPIESNDYILSSRVINELPQRGIALQLTCEKKEGTQAAWKRFEAQCEKVFFADLFDGRFSAACESGAEWREEVPFTLSYQDVRGRQYRSISSVTWSLLRHTVEDIGAPVITKLPISADGLQAQSPHQSATHAD